MKKLLFVLTLLSGILFFVPQSAQAATTIKLNKEYSGSIKSYDMKSYKLRLTKKTKIKLTTKVKSGNIRHFWLLKSNGDEVSYNGKWSKKGNTYTYTTTLKKGTYYYDVESGSEGGKYSFKFSKLKIDSSTKVYFVDGVSLLKTFKKSNGKLIVNYPGYFYRTSYSANKSFNSSTWYWTDTNKISYKISSKCKWVKGYDSTKFSKGKKSSYKKIKAEVNEILKYGCHDAALAIIVKNKKVIKVMILNS